MIVWWPLDKCQTGAACQRVLREYSDDILWTRTFLWWGLMNYNKHESWPSIENNTHFCIVGLFFSWLILFCLVFDDKDGNAAWQRRHRRQTRGEASSVSAMSQVLLQQPPVGAAHQVIIEIFEKIWEKILLTARCISEFTRVRSRTNVRIVIGDSSNCLTSSSTPVSTQVQREIEKNIETQHWQSCYHFAPSLNSCTQGI